MQYKLKTSLMLSTLLVVIVTINSCKKEDQAKETEQTKTTDQDLYDLAKATTGFVWYKKSTTLLNKSSGSAHPYPFLRTRYNDIAAKKLDANGKIIPGGSFAEGSMIVKELYENSTTIARYAILYKKAASTDADAKGWIWGYINADGKVAEPASRKGSSCISCHSQADNIDYMLMNKYFQ
jgi:hypothetical protein